MRVCQPSPHVLEHTLHGDHSSAAGSPRAQTYSVTGLPLPLCQDCGQTFMRTPQEEGRDAEQPVVVVRPLARGAGSPADLRTCPPPARLWGWVSGALGSSFPKAIWPGEESLAPERIV